MHPPLARALPHPFTIFLVDSTVRGKKKEKRKRKNASSTSQRRKRSQDDRCQRFFSAAPAIYLSGRLLFRSWGPPSLRSRVPLFAFRDGCTSVPNERSQGRGIRYNVAGAITHLSRGRTSDQGRWRPVLRAGTGFLFLRCRARLLSQVPQGGGEASAILLPARSRSRGVTLR